MGSDPTVAVEAAEPATATVLLVEDEVDLARMVEAYLRRAGFAVEHARTGPEAIAAAERRRPEVVVLDLGLPGLDGVEVCRRIRTFSDCYVLMLTARADEADRLVGLAVGADDYITKPFSPRELVARVQVVLRRPRQAAPEAPARSRLPTGLAVDPDGRRVEVDGRGIELTRTEFDILATMASRPSSAWSRQQIIESVWGPGWVGDEHVVDVHVVHLRRKLGDDSGRPRFVETVRGVGYRMATS
ncbi:response regulator transcription factor [Nocardioides sp. TRM66260-LWL]|uniref:response regulator transcription factor n=1 Tax=Nocardioides sp. TRM66260-LWL TaxID=2874478 RepID=UPI001CC7D308|nr:response regulator transcription factor [Nocardioides sp. TRM66260-LWL]MBZ5734109.1 response regulator transcription factor [Nocardioides sp. TRM66260-LWL]